MKDIQTQPVDLSRLDLKSLKRLETELEYEVSTFNIKQSTKKVQLNSAYGALGNQYFRFYDVRLAEAVTYSGQFVIKYLEQSINNLLNRVLKTDDYDYIVGMDTDSVYLRLDNVIKVLGQDRELSHEQSLYLVEKFCDKYVTKQIRTACDEIAAYMNTPDPKIQMKMEIVADRGIWTRKKRYILHVYKKEGVVYDPPKIEMKGVEAVKSSTPRICRQHMKDAIRIILEGTNDDVIAYIAEFRKTFYALPFDDIAGPISVNGLDKYAPTILKNGVMVFPKHTPFQVRGAWVYNNLLERCGLTKKYPLIKEGEKVKALYLKEPNVARSYIIAFPDVLPPELKLDKAVDLKLQFDKMFVNPIGSILEVIGWSTEKRNDLSALFE